MSDAYLLTEKLFKIENLNSSKKFVLDRIREYVIAAIRIGMINEYCMAC